MATQYSPKIVTGGLQLYLDASNPKSYIGSGTTWNDMTENADTFASSYYTYPSSVTSGTVRYFNFINNGTTINNIYNANPKIDTKVQTRYTRMAWFNLQTGNSAWSPIIQNSIGNNSDMGLTINGGYIHFRQYWNTYTSGTTYGDYGVSSVGTINTNTWNSAAIVVNLPSATVTFYINGKFDSTTSINTIGNSNSNIILIGGAETDSYSGDRMFKGYISSAMHYNRLLSSDEILQNHLALKSRFGI